MLYIMCSIYFSLLIYSTFNTSILVLFTISVLLGSYGLASYHELVHKHNLFNLSVCWKNHLQHHSSKDLEKNQRKIYTMPKYAIVRTFNYIFDLKSYSILDWIFLIGCILKPMLGFTVVLSLFITENIGYLQHNIKDEPIDFTNKFDNFISFNAGYHSNHHGKPSIHKVNTQIFLGLLVTYLWFFISISLKPILRFSKKKSNIPGAYLFGFFQNVANYKAVHGNSIKNLLYRMPSIFDNPSILLEYIKIMFRKEKVLGQLNEVNDTGFTNSHSISQIRNIYNNEDFLSKEYDSILIYKNEVIEGHHRYNGKIKNLKFYEIV